MTIRSQTHEPHISPERIEFDRKIGNALWGTELERMKDQATGHLDDALDSLERAAVCLRRWAWNADEPMKGEIEGFIHDLRCQRRKLQGLEP